MAGKTRRKKRRGSSNASSRPQSSQPPPSPPANERPDTPPARPGDLEGLAGAGSSHALSSKSSIVDQVLETLNHGFPPSLPRHILHGIYQRVKKKLAPNSPEDFEILSILAPHLAKEVGAAKIQLLNDANDPPRPFPSQPPPPPTPVESAKAPLASHTMQSTQTPVLNKFLEEVQRILLAKNGVELQGYLLIEPPFNDLYNTMIAEMRKTYPKGKEDALEEKCSRTLKEASAPDENGATWTIFVKFMANYFSFIRDVDPSNLLDTYNLLSELQQKSNSALSHPSKGIIILPTVIAYARVFARLAIGLDKNPRLIAHLVTRASEEDGRRETLPERAANVLRTAFVTCLNDRGTTPSGVKDGKPDGKKIGIYKIANLCLKILFQCDKKMNAEQIFTNIYNQSPPLSIYPASERVTYLYYLGRFHFSTNHFYPCQLALQAAYDQCLASPACVGQRRLILIYLIAANMILGRFPSQTLYDRPEAADLQERFAPIIHTLKKGDLESFKRLVDWDSPNAPWFMQRYKMLLQIDRLCEVIVWRSLFRRAFLLTGTQGDSETRKAPTLDLNYVLALFLYLEKRALYPPEKLGEFGPAPEPPPEAYYIDPDFVGADGKPLEGREAHVRLPTMLGIESKCSALISQGFMNGFISHRLKRFAIKGAKEKGSALAAGWPKFWDVIKADALPDCPGWKQDVASGPAGGGFGPGMVVNLSGARPVGSGPLG